MRLLRRTLSALLPLAVIGSVLTPLATARAAAPATVTVSRPVVDAADHSLVDITATGTIDPASGDKPRSMVLFYGDYQHQAGFVDCPATSATTCTVTFKQPAGDRAVSGSPLGYFVLFVTEQEQITADPPALPPRAVIFSPSNGTTLTGASTVNGGYTVVHAEGYNDSTVDEPRQIDLVVDGSPDGSMSCTRAGDSNDVCVAGVDLWVGGLTDGPHTLQVRYDVSNSFTGAVTFGPLSSPITVTVTHAALPAAAISLSTGPSVVTGTVGAAGSVHGVVTNPVTHKPLANVPVAVTFTPHEPNPYDADTQYTTSGADGTFTATDRYHLYYNVSVVATVDPARGGATASTTIGVRVPISCTLPAKAARNTTVTVSCSIPSLAQGSVAALHFDAPVPHQTQYAKTDKNGVVTFTTSFSHAQTLRVWVTTSTTHTFSASRSKDYYLTVS